MIEFYLGGARSGKSRLAEAAVCATGKARVYLATAQPRDGEMGDRIARHRADRDQHWLTIEEPLALSTALRQHAREDRCILVDCLTLWLSNWLEQGEDQWQQAKLEFLEVLPELPGDIVLVSNEVGQGVVPVNALARQFVDESGWLHQALATQCDRVKFVVAGIAITLKEN
ncbi:bifunctional adenosylcobinamide kinase/adenosylcobinamide-phosphate guanylyltransferase [Litorivivens sp.]|uniref:bifunctional adenosylcobinamide kinase/adenosylcobinamide-phosphate guanylyltransferase n=2 Tax=Litorivivens sp. TaxID=2020868 RepID=UPI00356AB1FB